MAAKKLPAEFTYDLSEFMKVDPNLIHYEEAAAVETGMKEPRGIAVGAEDRLYVAGDKVVRCFDAGRLGDRGNAFAAADPQRVAVNQASAVFVAMRDHVEVFDAAGKRQAAWETPGKDALLTCVAAGDADVFVADAGAPAVLRYDIGGRLVSRITGPPGRGTAADKADDQGFVVPSPYFDLAVASQDRLWIANPGRRRVELYTFDGSLLRHWGKASFKIEGFCGCCNPIHIAVLPGGHLVTSEKGLARVKVYTPEGELASVVAPPAAFAEGTTGLDVAADSRGRIWVLDPVARKVRLFVRKKTAPALEPKA